MNGLGIFLSIALILSLSVALSSGNASNDTLGETTSREPEYHPTAELFPEPAELAPNVAFWVDVYTKYDENDTIIHDNVDMDIRYETINLTKMFGMGNRRYMARKLSIRKKFYSDILVKLAKQEGDCFSPDECRVAALFGNTKDANRYRNAAETVRAQTGLSSRFRAGLVTSGQYMDDMRRIFTSYKLPLDLLALPHVESSFNVSAYSRVGAAGIWQFMRSTGKHFMKINNSIDERRDPLLATEAAAQFLKANYAEIGYWPLVVTSYNHGKNGALRAQREFGNDIAAIARNYDAPTFGFASRNFYAEFLAARKIMRTPEKYFGPIDFKTPMEYEMVKMDKNTMQKLAGRYGMERIAALNPALHKQVLRGNRPIPSGYVLKVPTGNSEKPDGIAPREQPAEKSDIPENTQPYIVKRGDSLYTVAKRFNTTPTGLSDLNDIDGHRIRPGQKLLVPAGNPDSVTAQDPPPTRVEAEPAPALIKPAAITTALSVQKSPLKPRQAEPIRVEQTTATERILAPEAESYRMVKVELNHGVLTVKPEETLGHFAEWSGTSVKAVLVLNHWKRLRQVHDGQTLLVPLTAVGQEKFEENRFRFHLKKFNTFFASHKINKVDNHVLLKGQSMWEICSGNGELPFWLLTMYNHGKRLDRLQPGEIIRIPVIARREL